jgi:hypothetical protein
MVRVLRKLGHSFEQSALSEPLLRPRRTSTTRGSNRTPGQDLGNFSPCVHRTLPRYGSPVNGLVHQSQLPASPPSPTLPSLVAWCDRSSFFPCDEVTSKNNVSTCPPRALDEMWARTVAAMVKIQRMACCPSYVFVQFEIAIGIMYNVLHFVSCLYARYFCGTPYDSSKVWPNSKDMNILKRILCIKAWLNLCTLCGSSIGFYKHCNEHSQ